MDVDIDSFRMVTVTSQLPMNPILPRRHFILASGSPRRRELLAMLDIDYTVDTSHPVDETVPPGAVATSEEIPAYLSRVKAAPYRDCLRPGDLLITADTVVILDGKVLGKPADTDEARAMLRAMSGRSHTVVTGVTLMTDDGRITIIHDAPQSSSARLPTRSPTTT